MHHLPPPVDIRNGGRHAASIVHLTDRHLFVDAEGASRAARIWSARGLRWSRCTAAMSRHAVPTDPLTDSPDSSTPKGLSMRCGGGLWVFGSLLPSVAGLAVMVVHASPTVWQID